MVSCHSHQKQSLPASPDFSWLKGNWINTSDSNATFYENWTASGTNTYQGNSFIIAHGDTVFNETIELSIADTACYYIVSVKNQNKGEKVSFKMISNEDNNVVFENKLHDFPQRIVYQYKAPDTLNAWIEGTVNHKAKKETFTMWRSTQN